ncbi:unnamed protein product [Soboliphyme baturini]|uniref:SCY1-like protein 2 n=1 Tax=Soboliphyme baturini TaxID=241478 RepID=A0A183ICM2_9BILA|nr:unnamed protein product [Soboliphyme baturini]
MVVEQIIPALSKISSKEPGVLMSVLGIFLLAYQNPKFCLTKEVCAKYCLPFLISASVEHSLNLKQFDAFFSLIMQMLKKIETEQRRHLTPENEFKIIANSPITSESTPLNAMSIKPMTNSAEVLSSSRSGTQLSLEDKKRLAQEQEKTMQLRAQPMLMPETVPAPVRGVGYGLNAATSDSSSVAQRFTVGPPYLAPFVHIPPPVSQIRNPVCFPPASNYVRLAVSANNISTDPAITTFPSVVDSVNWNQSIDSESAPRKCTPLIDPFKDLVKF